jgi:hypothetical protein
VHSPNILIRVSSVYLSNILKMNYLFIFMCSILMASYVPRTGKTPRGYEKENYKVLSWLKKFLIWF